MAPENPDRFVVIDGVQVSRARAIRRGLIKAEDADGPAETRARNSDSARRPEARADAAGTNLAAQVGDGAVSVGEDAARACAASTPAGDGSVALAGDSTATSASDTNTPPAGDPAATDTSATAANTSTPDAAPAAAQGDGKATRNRTR